MTSNEIKSCILDKFDMDFVGIADVKYLQNEEPGHRPTDLLPTAKNVIVFGRKMIDGAVQGCFRALEDHISAAQSSYAAFVNEQGPNFLLVSVTNNICRYLEDECGAVAMPLTFGNLQNMVWEKYPAPLFVDPYGQGMPLDLAKAAVAAGLGEIAWNNRFVTEKYGPRQILCAVITDMDIECDEPYSGAKLCDPEKCGICSEVCPTKAIPSKSCGAGKTVCIGSCTCEKADINVGACVVASLGMRREFSGRVPCPDLVMTDTPTDEELIEAFKVKPLNQAAIDHYPKYLCERCLMFCPLGNWQKNFADRNFTSYGKETEGTV